MPRENNYNEYYNRPSEFADKIITFWHSRMFDFASKHIPNLTNKSLLEVGVGFGYFANACKNKGVKKLHWA